MTDEVIANDLKRIVAIAIQKGWAESAVTTIMKKKYGERGACMADDYFAPADDGEMAETA